MANRVTRRQFMTRTGLAMGGIVLGPQLLAACGGDSEESRAGPGRVRTPSGSTTGPSTSTRPTTTCTAPAARWTTFQKESGLTIKYTEDFNDNNEYFAKIQPLLSKGEPIGPNIIAPTFWMAGRLIQLGWVEKLPLDKIPNSSNLLRVAHEAAVGPDRRVLAAVAVGHRRHRVQPRGHRAASSPSSRTCWAPELQGQGRDAHRDARHHRR